MALLLEQQRFSWWFWVLVVIPQISLFDHQTHRCSPVHQSVIIFTKRKCLKWQIRALARTGLDLRVPSLLVAWDLRIKTVLCCKPVILENTAKFRKKTYSSKVHECRVRAIISERIHQEQIMNNSIPVFFLCLCQSYCWLWLDFNHIELVRQKFEQTVSSNLATQKWDALFTSGPFKFITGAHFNMISEQLECFLLTKWSWWQFPFRNPPA